MIDESCSPGSFADNIPVRFSLLFKRVRPARAFTRQRLPGEYRDVFEYIERCISQFEKPNVVPAPYKYIYEFRTVSRVRFDLYL